VPSIRSVSEVVIFSVYLALVRNIESMRRDAEIGYWMAICDLPQSPL
jgi:hypothetical protein